MKTDREKDCQEKLRRQAEEQLANEPAPEEPTASHELQRMIEELRIHQFELQIQNEELQRAYAELELVKERYFHLYDLAPVGYATVSEKGIILEANLTMATMLGRTRKELVGTSLSLFIGKDDVDPYHLLRRRLFETEETQTRELRFVKEDDKTCWVEMVMSIIRVDDLRESRVVFLDISERKRAEELLDRNVDLERQVEQRTEELLKVQKQYLHAEKLAAIGRLSASIAHEFNNPLQTITTILKGLGRYAELKGKNAEFVNIALQECRRMSNLIISMQDFHRPSSGRYESVNLHNLIDSVLMLAQKSLQKKHISVVKEYVGELPAITAIADQLKQVFINLLNNAADACEGGGTIVITTELVDRNQVAVHVRDNGVGIDRSHIDRIFEPFYTTKTPNKGTGLGLSVTYGIVKDHGGRITVKSVPGEGTVFSVVLPLHGVQQPGLPA